jgi:hypothetical protein
MRIVALVVRIVALVVRIVALVVRIVAEPPPSLACVLAPDCAQPITRTAETKRQAPMPRADCTIVYTVDLPSKSRPANVDAPRP